MIFFKTNLGRINTACLEFMLKHKVNVKIFGVIYKILTT